MSGRHVVLIAAALTGGAPLAGCGGAGGRTSTVAVPAATSAAPTGSTSSARAPQGSAARPAAPPRAKEKTPALPYSGITSPRITPTTTRRGSIPSRSIYRENLERIERLSTSPAQKAQVAGLIRKARARGE